MPELPDVEAIRRYLMAQGLAGRSITGVELLWPKAVRTPSVDEFKSDVSGRRILDVRRRAKYLIFGLGGRSGRSLVLHLGMTGSLLVEPAGRERPIHTRNVLLLERRAELSFVDPRKLGAMWLVKEEGEVLAGLGPEPLEPAFTLELFSSRVSRRDVPVKALLCDQAMVAGIGNIYADEVLFLAGVHPLKRGRDMSGEEVERLHSAIVSRLAVATELLVPLVPGGGPPTEGRQGIGLLLMPRSEGSACSRCATPVGRVRVRGRSSYFCPHCQGVSG